MDSGARQSLKGSFFIAALILGLMVGVTWVVPSIIGALNRTNSATVTVVDRPIVPVEEVDKFLEDALQRLGAEEVLKRADNDAIIRGIYQLPRGAQTAMIAQRLRGFADEANIELYASPVDGLDLEVRAYAGPELRQQLLLVPDLPTPPTLKGALRNPDRPVVSIVVTDVGEASIDRLLKTKAPITVAIKPYTPFALRTARIAASKWHEVIAHVPKNMTAQEAQRAVPLATGIWYNGTPVAPLGTHDVVVVPAEEVSGARTPDGLRLVAAQSSDRRDSIATLNRTRHIAARMGRSAMVIEATDPGLPDVLAWATQAHTQGYRVVLASEAARWKEVRGPD